MTTVHDVAGDSMAPVLARGARVLVAPLDGPLRAGDVVLLNASGAPVLHRVVLTFEEAGEPWLVHRGDAGRRAAAAPASAVVGRAVAVLGKDAQPTASRFAPRDPWRFRRAQWRARGYVWARRLARAFGLRRRGPAAETVAAAAARDEDNGPALPQHEPDRVAGRPRISPAVAWRVLDGEAVVVDLARGRTLGLNRTGTIVWSMLPDHGEDAIVTAVAARFAVDADTARADVQRLVSALLERGFLVDA